jgi:DNA polymerase IV
MDAFYASIEQRDQPRYRDVPLVVGGLPEERGAVCAASYEARKFGIHSALPSRIAKQRCPHLIFVKPRFEVYRAVSAQIHSIFHRYTDIVEPVAFDEAYLEPIRIPQLRVQRYKQRINESDSSLICVFSRLMR